MLVDLNEYIKYSMLNIVQEWRHNHFFANVVIIWSIYLYYQMAGISKYEQYKCRNDKYMVFIFFFEIFRYSKSQVANIDLKHEPPTV